MKPSLSHTIFYLLDVVRCSVYLVSVARRAVVPEAKLLSGPGEQIFVGVSYCGVLMPVNYQMHLTGSLVLF